MLRKSSHGANARCSYSRQDFAMRACRAPVETRCRSRGRAYYSATLGCQTFSTSGRGPVKTTASEMHRAFHINNSKVVSAASFSTARVAAGERAWRSDAQEFPTQMMNSDSASASMILSRKRSPTHPTHPWRVPRGRRHIRTTATPSTSSRSPSARAWRTALARSRRPANRC